MTRPQGRHRPPRDFTTEELECYLAITGFMSIVFNEVTSAATIEEAYNGVFLAGNGGSAAEKLDRALLTAWLNFANGAIELDAPLDTDGDGIDDSTFAEVMTNAESVRTTAGVTDAELNEQREIVTNIATS